ncbi:MAG: hypothetical protein MK066_07875 [Crocinitomicaceae bacterium]|nr:hypothetical protein [Crocinitomicaceae bacterium]
MKNIFLILVITVISRYHFAFTQADSTSLPPEGQYYAGLERSFGIIPSVQVLNELYFGLDLGYGSLVTRCGIGGFFSSLGVDYNPIDRIWAPNITFQGNSFGLNFGINGTYYIQQNQGNFVLRPEIGFGLLQVLFINYGRNFFVRDDFSNVSKHTLTFSVYLPVLKF